MMDAKFKAKIQKLVDIRLRVEALSSEFIGFQKSLKGEKLDATIFDVKFILDQLEEFKTFHAYDLIEKISEVLGQVKNKKIKFNSKLHSILSHLLKISLQQIVIIQNIIENKIIAEETMTILDNELSLKSGLLTRNSKELKLPSITFSLGENVMDIINIEKKNIVSQSPGHLNIAIDTEKFNELNCAYADIISMKNELSEDKSFIDKGLNGKINSFSQLYEQLNLIPVNVYLEKTLQQTREFIDVKGKSIQLSSFWGNSVFPYFKMEYLESFSSLLLELLIDYGYSKRQLEDYIEVKTNLDNKVLNFKIKFNRKLPSFLEDAKNVDDHRVEKLHLLLDKLRGELTVSSIEEFLTEMIFEFPIKDEIHTAFLVEYDDHKIFVLQEDVEEVIVIEAHNLHEIDKKTRYLYLEEKIKTKSLVNQKKSVGSYDVGVIINREGEKFLIGIDKIVKKEQICLKPVKGERELKLKYGHDSIEVLNFEKNKDVCEAA